MLKYCFVFIFELCFSPLFNPEESFVNEMKIKDGRQLFRLSNVFGVFALSNEIAACWKFY
jgi:hypothetical protein